jgi:UDP-N-acetyl-2-amino-2-deoxyglucuronate dehydrogenase
MIACIQRQNQEKSMANFAMTGVGGYIAPRHLKAIKETGNVLLAAADPNDSVGVLDQYFYDTRFFTEFERFDRHAEKLKRVGEQERIHYVSICSPNYLHDAHIRFAMRIGADAICEKPLVINPWNLDALQELEQEFGKRVYTILQLRVHPSLVALKKKLTENPLKKKADIVLTYVTSRGNWYLTSWKGDVERSGGLATNIGIHFFDMLLWLFGPMSVSEVHLFEPRKAAGYLELQNAKVKWYLSIDPSDLARCPIPKTQRTYRSITCDGSEIEFSEGFTDLHTVVYKETLAGRGFGIDDARQSINLAHLIRNSKPTGVSESSHPYLKEG